MFSLSYICLIDLISGSPLSLSDIGYTMVFLCLVCIVESLYSGFQVWNSHVAVVEAEH